MVPPLRGCSHAAFQSQMRSQFPRHFKYTTTPAKVINVSISDEKPVPSPRIVTFMLLRLHNMFQSQMRSQFPRHYARRLLREFRRKVSISDEKPVPSPLHMTNRHRVGDLCFNLR